MRICRGFCAALLAAAAGLASAGPNRAQPAEPAPAADPRSFDGVPIDFDSVFRDYQRLLGEYQAGTPSPRERIERLERGALLDYPLAQHGDFWTQDELKRLFGR